MVNYSLLEKSNSKITLVGRSSIQLEFYWNGQWNKYVDESLLLCLYQLTKDHPNLISYKDK